MDLITQIMNGIYLQCRKLTPVRKFIHSFFLETYLASLQETTTQRRNHSIVDHKVMTYSGIKQFVLKEICAEEHESEEP